MRFTAPIHGRSRTIPVRYFVAGGVESAPDGSIAGSPRRGLYDASTGYSLAPDFVFRFENLSNPSAYFTLDGSTSSHATAKVISTAFTTRINGVQWIASSADGYRQNSSRICCIGQIGRGRVSTGGSFYGDNVGLVFDGIDEQISQDIGQGIFVDAVPSRKGVFLCGELNTITLQSPFALCSIGPVSQILSDARLFDPHSATTPINYKITYPYAFAESCIDIVGVQGQPQRVLLAFAPATIKCAVCHRTSDSKFFVTAVSGRSCGLRPGWPDSSNYDGQPTVLRPPTPLGVGAWRDNTINCSFVRFECNSLEVSAELASRNDCAHTSTEVNTLWAGVENTTPSALVCDETPFDFAAIVSVPFLSSTIQQGDTLQNPVQFFSGDVSFENPQHVFVNSPSVLGVGSKASRLPQTERIANATTATYRKHGPGQSGTLAEEDMSLVQLRSYRMLSNSPPLCDDDVCFPVMQPAGQSVFRFRGHDITGNTVSFVPWSSNTFTSPVTSFGKTQLTAPQIVTALPVNGFGLPSSQRGTVLSGTYLLPDRAITYEEVATPATYPLRLYNRTTYTLPPCNAGNLSPFAEQPSHPPLKAVYHPNSAFDELAFMTGALASACPSVNTTSREACFYGTGKPSGESEGREGWRLQNIEDNHPAGWNVSLSVSASGANYTATSTKYSVRSSPSGFASDLTASLHFMPSLAGKEYQCTSKQLFGGTLQAGLFHCLGTGVQQQDTAVMLFKGLKETKTGSITPSFDVPTRTEQSAWDGSAMHVCTFRTTVVELFVRWSATLQSPGPYQVREPLPRYRNYNGLATSGSVLAPSMFCRQADAANVTPILVADVWVRAIGECDVSSTYTFPSAFGTSGTYGHTINVWQTTNQGIGIASDPVDLASASYGHAETPFFNYTRVWPTNQNIPTSQKSTRYLGSFPFNRAQTQRLLNGETVTPTYWFLDDEGSALESQPVTVPWHNGTFGTYKLEFRLVAS